VGTSSPGTGTSSYYDDLVIKNDGAGTGAGITIQSNSTNGFSGLDLRTAGGTEIAKIAASVATSKLSIDAGGSTAITVDSSQRVGIGTTSPTHQLTVHSASTTSGTVEANRFSVRNNYGSATGLGNGFISPSSNNLAFVTNSTERMRIDSSGNVIFQRGADVGNILQITGADTTSELLEIGISSTGGNAQLTATHSAGGSNTCGLIFRTRGSGGTAERMRLDSAGSLLHGRTTSYHGGSGPEMLALQGDRNGMVIFNTTNLNYYLITLRSQYANNSNNGLAGTYLIFQDQGGTVRGSITVSTSTAYNTTSDYRQKENIVNLTGAIDRVKDLSPKRFNWIGRPSSEQIDGFIAHEAQAVVPEAVTGTHNEVDDDGNAVMQGIDQSKLVPLLTAALQESIAKIETLELPNKNPINIRQTTSLLNNPFITFLNSSGDTAGSIIQNGVNSVTYATSSDYRLKDNVVELTAAIPRLKQLAPKRFNFTAAADVTVDGFLAHEAQTVVPEAVTGSHNQVDGDGNPVMQGIDQSKLVPLLTAALQEAIGRIETLETRIATLEGS
jgi:hypothetical protein